MLFFQLCLFNIMVFCLFLVFFLFHFRSKYQFKLLILVTMPLLMFSPPPLLFHPFLSLRFCFLLFLFLFFFISRLSCFGALFASCFSFASEKTRKFEYKKKKKEKSKRGDGKLTNAGARARYVRIRSGLGPGRPTKTASNKFASKSLAQV